jgi:hypothetical protein
VRTEDPPLAFSPEGLSNVPVGSAGRPAPTPDVEQAWSWEEVRQLAQKRGRIFINGRDFCAVTPFTTLAGLRTMIDRCKNSSAKDRASWLSAQVACWFRPAHLRRQQTVLLGRTATLTFITGFAFVLWLMLSVYFLTGSTSLLDGEKTTRVGELLPMFGLYLLCLHVICVILGWRVHRRLLPKRGEARLNLMLNAALLPPQALRLRSRIGAEFLQQAHPLAWLAVAASQADFEEYARQAVADLRWPLVSRRVADAELHASISAWMSERVSGEIERLLLMRGVSQKELLKAPTRDSASSCAFCPRCQTQFTTDTDRCPRGIKLEHFK